MGLRSAVPCPALPRPAMPPLHPAATRRARRAPLHRALPLIAASRCAAPHPAPSLEVLLCPTMPSSALPCPTDRTQDYHIRPSCVSSDDFRRSLYGPEPL